MWSNRVISKFEFSNSYLNVKFLLKNKCNPQNVLLPGPYDFSIFDTFYSPNAFIFNIKSTSSYMFKPDVSYIYICKKYSPNSIS